MLRDETIKGPITFGLYLLFLQLFTAEKLFAPSASHCRCVITIFFLEELRLKTTNISYVICCVCVCVCELLQTVSGRGI